MSLARARSFAQLAEEELNSARKLAPDQPRQAAYFVQQAAEKLARAVLEAEGIAAGPTHNLGQLAALLAPDHGWRQPLMLLDRHSPAATRYRYPNPGGKLAPPPPRQRIEADIAEIEALLAAALRAFKLG